METPQWVDKQWEKITKEAMCAHNYYVHSFSPLTGAKKLVCAKCGKKRLERTGERMTNPIPDED